MSFSFATSPTPDFFTSYLSKKDDKYDISTLIISFITFCALSAFCSVIFVINFTFWFIATVISKITGITTKRRINPLSEKKFEKFENMLDHRLNSSHRILNNNHFEDFRLSSSIKDNNSLPSIPSYRSSNKSNNSNKTSNKSNSILSFDFSLNGLIGNNKSSKNKKDIQILTPSECSTKRNEKRTKNKHIPDIPSQLGPNRQNDEWKSSVDYYLSERHSHSHSHSRSRKPKSKLSVTERMIESTAAYRVGRKRNGWINGEYEEHAVRQKDSTTDFISCDPFYSQEPIKELNIRLDQERPKITGQERRAYNKSPATSLHYARQYLTILLNIKKEMNL